MVKNRTFLAGPTLVANHRRQDSLLLARSRTQPDKKMVIGQVLFFFCAFNTVKKRSKVKAILVKKEVINWPRRICSCGTESVHDMPIFPYRLANQTVAFASFHRALEEPAA